MKTDRFLSLKLLITFFISIYVCGVSQTTDSLTIKSGILRTYSAYYELEKHFEITKIYDLGSAYIINAIMVMDTAYLSTGDVEPTAYYAVPITLLSFKTQQIYTATKIKQGDTLLLDVIPWNLYWNSCCHTPHGIFTSHYDKSDSINIQQGYIQYELMFSQNLKGLYYIPKKEYGAGAMLEYLTEEEINDICISLKELHNSKNKK